LQADITQPADIDSTIQQTVDKWGVLDILVTNCGGPPACTFYELNTEQWETSINQILLSAVRLIKAALPHLRQSAAPAILTITSVSAKQPIPNLIISNYLRSGILGLTKTLSQELAPAGIRVNSILPGWIATDRQKELIAARAAKSGKTPE
jgi:3-oxoacyl-[acyl-carrier protein] reductase